MTLFPLLVAGCGGSQKETSQPLDQVATPAVAQEIPPLSEAPQEPKGTEESPGQPNPGAGKLVPIDTKYELDFTMLHPEGWHVFVTGLKDGV